MIRTERIVGNPILSISMPVLSDSKYDDEIMQMTNAAVHGIADHTKTPFELLVSYHTEDESIARVHNEAFKKAEGEIFCCIHNDTMVTEGWDKPLVVAAQWGDVSFPLVLENKLSCAVRGQKPNEKWETSSCCFMLTRELFQAVGGYDESYKGIHYEDWDLFMKAKHYGSTLARADCSVWHMRSVTRSYGDTDRELGYLKANQEVYREKWADLYDGKLPQPVLSEVPNAAV